MILLAEITDKDFDSGFIDDPKRKYIFRRAARCVVFTEKGEIGVISARKDKYYKIPGGGVEQGEDIISALKREIMEESGCECDEFKGLGVIIDQRSVLDEQYGLVQLSYGYVSKLNVQGKPQFTKREQNEAFEFQWVQQKDALKLFERNEVEDYHVKFIQKRDGIFLSEALKAMSIKT
ncbi:MAG: NUDIX domain-containing protein [Candidatus Dojkabacteria bacterium]|nr:NUDIX domain-containing protein [Candidatus Dojkabacteria bacterium]